VRYCNLFFFPILAGINPFNRENFCFPLDSAMDGSCVKREHKALEGMDAVAICAAG
jgi:hypothetical protein